MDLYHPVYEYGGSRGREGQGGLGRRRAQAVGMGQEVRWALAGRPRAQHTGGRSTQEEYKAEGHRRVGHRDGRLTEARAKISSGERNAGTHKENKRARDG